MSNETIEYLSDIDYSALRRGYDLIEVDDNYFLAWPKCEITECSAYICIGLSKTLCYPHGIELSAFTEKQFEDNRKQRFQCQT